MTAVLLTLWLSLQFTSASNEFSVEFIWKWFSFAFIFYEREENQVGTEASVLGTLTTC